MGAVWALALVGGLPPSWAGDAGIAFAVTLGLTVFWFRRRLKRWLFHSVWRRLAISHLLIALPVLLVGLFSLSAGYVVFGEFGFFALEANLGARGAAFAVAAREILIAAPPGSERTAVADAVNAAAADLEALAPGVSAWILERSGDRVTSAVGSEGGGGATSPIPVAGRIPDWANEPYEGVVQTSTGRWFAAVTPDRHGRVAAVFAPLTPVLRRSAAEEDLSLRRILALFVGDDRDQPPEFETIGGSSDPGRFTILAIQPFLLEAVPWEPELGGGRVLVRYAMSPLDMIQGTTTGLADSVALNSEDAGSGLVLALTGLGIVFLLATAAAIVMGGRLAYSITQSVAALSEGTRRVREGNFGHEVRVDSEDQFGELASSFNIMTAKIADDMDRLREAAVLEQEMETARESQARLLPPEGSVRVPGFSVAAVCRPATQVGGDYYDLIPLAPRRLGVVIADVAGTGARAAFIMAELKGIVLALSRLHTSPRQVLIEANRVLHGALDARTFITITYAVFDSAAQSVTFARAGHSPLIHLTREGGWPRSEALAPGGLGLAMDPGPMFETILEEESRPLRAGETWLLFTDGVSEAMNEGSDMFGEERLMKLLEDNASLQPAELQQTVEEAVSEFTGGTTHADDLTMVFIQVQ